MKEILSGLFIAVISSFITIQLSLRQFKSQRWWDKKLDYYSQLLDALHSMSRYFSDMLDAELAPNGISKNHEQFLNDLHKKGYDKIRQLFEIGGLFVSNNLLKKIKSFLSEIDRIGNIEETSYFEMLDSGYDATKTCIENVITFAKKDLSAELVSDFTEVPEYKTE